MAGYLFASRQTHRERAMQESNLRLPKGAPDRGTATGNAGEPPQDLSLCRDPKGRGKRGQSTRGHVAPSRLANRPHPALRICREEVPMVVSIRVRQVLIAVIALLPLVLAACNNGNSSGY